MNYKKHYDLLISSRQLLQENRQKLRRERRYNKTHENYLEKHHIIPKSLGGSDEKENLILLTAREHYIAHWLLSKIYPKSGLSSALWYFSNSKQNGYLKIGSRKFELMKRQNTSKHGSLVKDKIKWLYYIEDNPLVKNFWLKANLVYDVWIANSQWGYAVIKKLCVECEIINFTNDEELTNFSSVNSIIKKFKKGWIPLEDVEWLMFVNINGGIQKLPKNMHIPIKTNHPWEQIYHGKKNQHLLMLWKTLDEYYKIWISNDKPKGKRLATLSENLKHDQNRLDNLVNWFFKYGDPTKNEEWLRFKRDVSSNQSRFN